MRGSLALFRLLLVSLITCLFLPRGNGSLFLLCLVVVLASHWMGCVYASVYPWDEVEDARKQNPELDSYGMQTRQRRYVACVYWAMQTITTVGYGDMQTTKPAARVVAFFSMALGGLIFGWLIMMKNVQQQRGRNAQTFRTANNVHQN